MDSSTLMLHVDTVVIKILIFRMWMQVDDMQFGLNGRFTIRGGGHYGVVCREWLGAFCISQCPRLLYPVDCWAKTFVFLKLPWMNTCPGRALNLAKNGIKPSFSGKALSLEEHLWQKKELWVTKGLCIVLDIIDEPASTCTSGSINVVNQPVKHWGHLLWTPGDLKFSHY